YLLHRLAFPLGDVPHLDMLHPARRLWRDPSPGVTCALTTLERQLAGVHRVGDVPGFEIPARYFQFVRDGDARPLEAVLEHNRLDLLSTALLMARALGLLRRGPAAASGPRECLGLGRIYDRAGAVDEAAVCYREAAALVARAGRQAEVQAEALRRLAASARRGGRMDEAVSAWKALVDLRGCPAALRLEAREALAIHHEHRSRDLAEARQIVLDALNDAPDARRRDAVEYRLRRLERKMAGRNPGRLMAALDDEA
ncbi:MAG: ribonuclease H-like domain-containing protein, partial [Vicinamibacteria bacterium]